MPMLITLRMRLPVNPVHAPLRTRSENAAMRPSTAWTSGTTSRPSTRMLRSRRRPQGDVQCRALLGDVDVLAAKHRLDASLQTAGFAERRAASGGSRPLCGSSNNRDRDRRLPRPGDRLALGRWQKIRADAAARSARDAGKWPATAAAPSGPAAIGYARIRPSPATRYRRRRRRARGSCRRCASAARSTTRRTPSRRHAAIASRARRYRCPPARNS